MRSILLAAFCVLLASCAFQLRGKYALPDVMASTYIGYAGTNGNVPRQVARALILNDVTVVTSPSETAAVLEILSARTSSRMLVKDRNGRARESEIKTTIAFRLLDADGNVLVGQQIAERRDTVLLDPDDPLGSAGEVRLAADGLFEEAVWEMLRLLEIAEIRPPETASDADSETGTVAE